MLPIGLGIELVYGVFFSNWPLVEKFIIGGANFLVAGGVWVEVHFGRKARVAGDNALEEAKARIAEANARAAEADLKVEQPRKELAWRWIIAQQAETIIGALDKHKPFPALVLSWAQGDPEARLYADDI